MCACACAGAGGAYARLSNVGLLLPWFAFFAPGSSSSSRHPCCPVRVLSFPVSSCPRRIIPSPLLSRLLSSPLLSWPGLAWPRLTSPRLALPRLASALLPLLGCLASPPLPPLPLSFAGWLPADCWLLAGCLGQDALLDGARGGAPAAVHHKSRHMERRVRTYARFTQNHAHAHTEFSRHNAAERRRGINFFNPPHPLLPVVPRRAALPRCAAPLRCVFASPRVCMRMRMRMHACVCRCTVIEMMTGQPPWSEIKSLLQVLLHIAQTDKPPAIPQELGACVRPCVRACGTLGLPPRRTVALRACVCALACARACVGGSAV